MGTIGHLETKPCEFKHFINPDDPNSPYVICGAPSNKFGDKFLCYFHNPVYLKIVEESRNRRIKKELKKLGSKINTRKRVKAEEDAIVNIFNDKESFYKQFPKENSKSQVNNN